MPRRRCPPPRPPARRAGRRGTCSGTRIANGTALAGRIGEHLALEDPVLAEEGAVVGDERDHRVVQLAEAPKLGCNVRDPAIHLPERR